MRRVAWVLCLAGCDHASRAVEAPTACPELPPKAALVTVPADAPSHRDLGLGSGGIQVSVVDEEGAPLHRRFLRAECACLERAVFFATGDDGKARLEGLPAGKYAVTLSDPWDTSSAQATFNLPPGRTFVFRMKSAVKRLQAAPDEPPDSLDPEVVLQVQTTGCLGPCRSFIAELLTDDRLRIKEDGRIRTRTIEPRAREAAMARAECLVTGPSYDSVMATDFPWFKLRMRRPDGTVAVYRHYTGDRRGTPERRNYEEKLLRTLGLHRR